MGGEELKWHQLAHHSISDIAIASAHSEKTRLKKMIMIISMNKSQETTVLADARN